jgi:2-oxoisovalerate dehydrogenase E2 component (dihydrolipoyl transacylase)
MGKYVFKLPDVGEGTAQAEIAEWHVKVGDKVTEDQNLVDVTTDKATVELPSPVSGVIVALNGAPGDVIAVGSELVVLETEGEARAPAKAEAPPKPAAKNGNGASAPQAAKPTSLAVEKKAAPVAAKPLAAPAIRERAKTLGVDLKTVSGSGPEGRVTHADLDAQLKVRAPVSAPPPSAPLEQREGVEEVKIIGIRRKIAERMQEAKRHIPHFAYVEEVDVTALEELRGELNRTYADHRSKLSVLPFIMRAVVKATVEFPQVNALFDDAAGILRRHQGVHIGIATQTEKGLMVPVVFHAEAKDLWTCASEVQRVAELMGSTITITSLGKLGGIVTTPVINYPEVAIIGVNKVMERPMVRGGQVVIRQMMNLSSSFDHRVVDGAVAAEFIQRMKSLLEQPAILFID